MCVWCVRANVCVFVVYVCGMCMCVRDVWDVWDVYVCEITVFYPNTLFVPLTHGLSDIVILFVAHLDIFDLQCSLECTLNGTDLLQNFDR